MLTLISTWIEEHILHIFTRAKRRIRFPESGSIRCARRSRDATAGCATPRDAGHESEVTCVRGQTESCATLAAQQPLEPAPPQDQRPKARARARARTHTHQVK